MIVDVFFRYLIGHLVGDFVLQPLWLAIAKRQGWRGLLIHVTVVTVATAIIIAGTVSHWVWWMVALFAIHLFIDQFRTFVFTDNSKGRGLLLLTADQLAHLASLVLLSWWATGESPRALGAIFSAPLSQTNSIFFIFGMVILAFWVAPIVEIEVIVAIASFRNAANRSVAPIALTDRLMGGLERTLTLALVASGWWLVSPLVFVPRAVWLQRGESRRHTLYPKMLTSIILAVLMSWLLVQVY